MNELLILTMNYEPLSGFIGSSQYPTPHTQSPSSGTDLNIDVFTPKTSFRELRIYNVGNCGTADISQSPGAIKDKYRQA